MDKAALPEGIDEPALRLAAEWLQSCPDIVVGSISAQLLGGLTSESSAIYVQCQCPRCVGKASLVGLNTLEQHVEHVTGDEVPAGSGNQICRNFLYFQAEPSQIPFKAYMRHVGEQYRGKGLVGNRLWQFRFDSQVAAAAGAPAGQGVWVKAQVTAYNDKSGEHEVEYAEGSPLSGKRAKVYIGATPIHFGSAAPAAGTAPNRIPANGLAGHTALVQGTRKSEAAAEDRATLSPSPAAAASGAAPGKLVPNAATAAAPAHNGDANGAVRRGAEAAIGRTSSKRQAALAAPANWAAAGTSYKRQAAAAGVATAVSAAGGGSKRPRIAQPAPVPYTVGSGLSQQQQQQHMYGAHSSVHPQQYMGGLAVVGEYDAHTAAAGVRRGKGGERPGSCALQAPAAAAPGTSGLSDIKTSRFRGVSWNKRTLKWQVTLYARGRYRYFGSYTNQEEAACAYDRAALVWKGPSAQLNYPASTYLKGNQKQQLQQLQEQARQEAEKGNEPLPELPAGEAGTAALEAIVAQRQQATGSGGSSKADRWRSSSTEQEVAEGGVAAAANGSEDAADLDPAAAQQSARASAAGTKAAALDLIGSDDPAAAGDSEMGHDAEDGQGDDGDDVLDEDEGTGAEDDQTPAGFSPAPEGEHPLLDPSAANGVVTAALAGLKKKRRKKAVGKLFTRKKLHKAEAVGHVGGSMPAAGAGPNVPRPPAAAVKGLFSSASGKPNVLKMDSQAVSAQLLTAHSLTKEEERQQVVEAATAAAAAAAAAGKPIGAAKRKAGRGEKAQVPQQQQQQSPAGEVRLSTGRAANSQVARVKLEGPSDSSDIVIVDRKGRQQQEQRQPDCKTTENGPLAALDAANGVGGTVAAAVKQEDGTSNADEDAGNDNSGAAAAMSGSEAADDDAEGDSEADEQAEEDLEDADDDADADDANEGTEAAGVDGAAADDAGQVGMRRSQRQAARKAQKKTARRMASVVNARSDGLWARLMRRAGSDADSDTDGGGAGGGSQADGGDLEAIAPAGSMPKDGLGAAAGAAAMKQLLEAAGVSVAATGGRGRGKGRGRGRGRRGQGRRGRPPGTGIAARMAELHAQFVALGGVYGGVSEEHGDGVSSERRGDNAEVVDEDSMEIDGVQAVKQSQRRRRSVGLAAASGDQKADEVDFDEGDEAEQDDEEIGNLADDDADVAALLLGLTGAAGVDQHRGGMGRRPSMGDEAEGGMPAVGAAALAAASYAEEEHEQYEDDEQRSVDRDSYGAGGTGRKRLPQRAERGFNPKYVDDAEEWNPKPTRGRGRGKGRGRGRYGTGYEKSAAAAASSGNPYHAGGRGSGRGRGRGGGRGVGGVHAGGAYGQQDLRYWQQWGGLGGWMAGIPGLMGCWPQQQQQLVHPGAAAAAGDEDGSGSEAERDEAAAAAGMEGLDEQAVAVFAQLPPQLMAQNFVQVMFMAFTTGAPHYLAQFQSMYSVLSNNQTAMGQVMNLLFQFGAQMGATIASSGQAATMAAAFNSIAAASLGMGGMGGMPDMAAMAGTMNAAAAAMGAGAADAANGAGAAAAAMFQQQAQAAAAAAAGAGAMPPPVPSASAAPVPPAGTPVKPAAAAGDVSNSSAAPGVTPPPTSAAAQAALPAAAAATQGPAGPALRPPVWPPIVPPGVAGVPGFPAGAPAAGFNPSAAAAAAAAAGMPPEYVRVLMGLQLEDSTDDEESSEQEDDDDEVTRLAATAAGSGGGSGSAAAAAGSKGDAKALVKPDALTQKPAALVVGGASTPAATSASARPPTALIIGAPQTAGIAGAVRPVLPHQQQREQREQRQQQKWGLNLQQPPPQALKQLVSRPQQQQQQPQIPRAALVLNLQQPPTAPQVPASPHQQQQSPASAALSSLAVTSMPALAVSAAAPASSSMKPLPAAMGQILLATPPLPAAPAAAAAGLARQPLQPSSGRGLLLNLAATPSAPQLAHQTAGILTLGTPAGAGAAPVGHPAQPSTVIGLAALGPSVLGSVKQQLNLTEQQPVAAAPAAAAPPSTQFQPGGLTALLMGSSTPERPAVQVSAAPAAPILGLFQPPM